MPTTVLTDLYEGVLPELPKAPKGLVLLNIRNVLREFFHRSMAYEHVLPLQNVEDGKTDYELDSDIEETEIDAVMKVEQDGSELTPATHYTVSVDKTMLVLETEPDADSTDGLEITVSLKTLRTATKVETRLFDDWHEVWESGVKAKMMLQPRKPWTDQAMGLEYHRQYWEGIRAATHERLRNRVNRTITLRPTYSFT